MHLGTARLMQLAVRLGGLAAFLLALGMLGTPAPAYDDTKPPQGKDQPKAAKDQSPKKDEPKPAKAKDQPPKKDAPKAAPVKLGLSINDPRALPGYTLFSPFASPNTYLLDMQGRVVRTWQSDCSPALSGFLLDNGHLLRPGSIGGDANIFGPGPGVGGRIQEFTWEGELVWDFKFYNARQLPHHDMTRLPNGNLLLIVWDRKTTEEALAAGRRPEMTGDKHLLPDSLVEIKPTGKTTGEVVWEWRLWDHLVQDFDKTKANYGNVAQHPELVNLNYGEDELPSATAKANPTTGPNPPPNRPVRVDPDYTHFNGVAYNPDLDQISVSVWKFSEFWIIDHSTTTAEAASHKGGRSGKGGDLLYRWGNPRAYRAGTKADRKLFSQHNAHWIPRGLPGAGHLLVFNNGPDRSDGNYSSVDELEMPADTQGRYTCKPGSAYEPARPVWNYTAPKKTDFYSWFISGAQRLANGNTLICAGAYGTFFEVTPEKEIVWKYVNPVKFGSSPSPSHQPGHILSPIVGDFLAISTMQRKQIDEIQKDIDAHLDMLLTADQKKQSVGWPKNATASGYGPPPTPSQVMTTTEQHRLKLTDDQKKDLTALQKAVDARFDQVLTEAQRKQIKSAFAPFSPPPAPPAADNPTGPHPGKILTAAQQNTLKLSPEQRKRMEEIQKELDAKLETLLTEAQKKQLQVMRQAPPPGRTAPPGGPGQARLPSGGTPVFRAYRYSLNFPGFAGKTLTPGKPLEELKPNEQEKKVAELKK
jgi:hypothetical protein